MPPSPLGISPTRMSEAQAEDSLRRRSAEEVLEDHLRLRKAGELETDLRRNYAADVVLLTPRETARGHDGVRSFAGLLYEAVSEWGRFEYHSRVADDRIALLEWSAESDGYSIRDGVDSYLIERGLILVQTLRYTVVSTDLSVFGADRAASAGHH